MCKNLAVFGNILPQEELVSRLMTISPALVRQMATEIFTRSYAFDEVSRKARKKARRNAFHKFRGGCFNRLNDLCFEGKLPPVQISLVKARTLLGKMEYRTRHTLPGSSIVFC